MTRVYISSSYEDLKEYREAAARAVRSLDWQPVGMEDYPASSRPPLEKCLEDVRSCDYYIGIVARRYGSTPPDSERSFTHHEFDEARERLQCLVFLLDEDAEWPEAFCDKDPSKVDAFRSLVSDGRIIKTFSSSQSLETVVSQALAASVLDSRPQIEIPPLLPYMSDRSVQRDQLADAIAAHRRDRPRRPLLVVIHGDEREEHGTFVERLHQITFPDLLGLDLRDPDSEPMSRFSLTWATQDGTPDVRLRTLRSRLAEKITGSREAGEQDIVAALSRLRSPTMVSSQVLAGEWNQEEQQLIDAWIDDFTGWPDLAPGRFLTILVSFLYTNTADLSFFKKRRLAKRNEGLKTIVNNLESREASGVTLAVLTELQSVREADVLAWINDQVARFCRESHGVVNNPVEMKAQLERELRTYFRSFQSGRIPMETLAQKLRQLLEECLSQGV